MRAGRSDFLDLFPSRALAQKHAFLPLFAAMAKSNKRKSYDLSLIKDFSKTILEILAI